MGEKAAWEFMDKLHQNIAEYTTRVPRRASRPRRASG